VLPGAVEVDPCPHGSGSQAESHDGSHDASSPAAVSREGDVVAEKYLLLRPIAQGAMGTVWSARHVALDVPVAIKIVHPHVKYPFVAPALLWEAQAASKLSHPAIVKVYDFGRTERGDTFIVMEHLAGETLRGLLRRKGRLSSSLAVKLLLPVADGLDAVHARGIVHRDVKPENVVLVADHLGRLQPKLVDFGVAKLSWVDDVWVTGATVVGTPGYMPLEQASGADIDGRADVWAFSATLYELISGALPFEARNMKTVLHALEHEEVPLLAARANVDQELSFIVQRGLSRSVTDRWPTIGALRDALAGWLISQPVPVSLPPQSRSLAYRPVRGNTSGLVASGVVPPSGVEATSLVIPLTKRTRSVPSSGERCSVHSRHSKARGVHARRGRSRALRWAVAVGVASAGVLGGRWLPPVQGLLLPGHPGLVNPRAQPSNRLAPSSCTGFDD